MGYEAISMNILSSVQRPLGMSETLTDPATHEHFEMCTSHQNSFVQNFEDTPDGHQFHYIIKKKVTPINATVLIIQYLKDVAVEKVSVCRNRYTNVIIGNFVS